MDRSQMTESYWEQRWGWSEEPRQTIGVPDVSSMFCPIVAVGLLPAGQPFGDDVLMHIRMSAYRMLEVAFVNEGVCWKKCETRGDVVLFAIHPDISAEVLLGQLVTRLRAGLRQYNRVSNDIAQFRLRMGLHVGRVSFSPVGMIGFALTRLTDLLDAPAFLREFADSSADLGLVASDYLYDELIQYGLGLIDPANFRPIKVPTREAQTCAWVHFP